MTKYINGRMVTTDDYFGREVRVGDKVRAMCKDYGVPDYAFQEKAMTVVEVKRTRLVVTGSGFNGTIKPTAKAMEIIERNGKPFTREQ